MMTCARAGTRVREGRAAVGADEANNRVFKLYADVEFTAYYRANAANNNGTEGQLVAPYLIRVVTSYNF